MIGRLGKRWGVIKRTTLRRKFLHVVFDEPSKNLKRLNRLICVYTTQPFLRLYLFASFRRFTGRASIHKQAIHGRMRFPLRRDISDDRKYGRRNNFAHGYEFQRRSERTPRLFAQARSTAGLAGGLMYAPKVASSKPLKCNFFECWGTTVGDVQAKALNIEYQASN